jgi:uncharacterized membrane protein
LTALAAGLFYARSCSVRLSFARLNDREFVSVMQKTNRAIQNPVFFIAFFGAPIFLVISTVTHHNQFTRFGLLLAAAVIYLIGTFGATIFGSLPMRNALDRFNLEPATEEEIARQRVSFERRWNGLKYVRIVSSTIALTLVVIACLNY